MKSTQSKTDSFGRLIISVSPSRSRSRSPAPSHTPRTPLVEKRDKILEFNEFCALQTVKNPHELAVLYNDYNYELQKRYAADYDFYLEHRNEEWFMEKYNPVTRIEHRIELDLGVKARHEQFLEAKKNNLLDHVLNIDFAEKAPPSGENLVDYNENSESEAEESVQCFDQCVYAGKVMPDVSRSEILKEFESLPGFQEVLLTDPAVMKGFSRHCLVRFDTNKNALSAIKALEGRSLAGRKMYPKPNQSSNRRPNLAPHETLTEERLQVDLAQTGEVIKLFNRRRQISGDISLPDGALVQRVNLNLEYLRRVHCFCYYCGKQYTSPSDLYVKCPCFHGRLPGTAAKAEMPKDDKEDKISFFDLWSKNIDEQVTKLLNSPEPEKPLGVGAMRELCDVETLAYHTVETKKKLVFSCYVCAKNFKGPEFVENHVLSKHLSEISSRNNDRLDELYFRNYLRDENRIKALPRRSSRSGFRRSPRRGFEDRRGARLGSQVQSRGDGNYKKRRASWGGAMTESGRRERGLTPDPPLYGQRRKLRKYTDFDKMSSGAAVQKSAIDYGFAVAKPVGTEASKASSKEEPVVIDE